MRNIEHAAGSGTNIIQHRRRRLTEATSNMQGIEFIIVSKSVEESLFLREILRCIKRANVSDERTLNDIDIEQMIKRMKDHIIMFIDDLKECSNETL